MPFSLKDLARLRPYAYHLTARENLARIVATARLDSAAAILAAAGRSDEAATKRRAMTPVSIGGEIVLLRDQAPLHEGNVDFGGGWDFSDVVRDLNRRVFFWPGDERGPNEYGVRHFERYREDRPVILRVRLDDLLNHNKAVRPALCRYNSGSPRCSGGRRSPRGPNTFLPADIWPYAPSGVVEITFLGAIGLPVDTQVSDMPSGPWRPLFDTRAMRV